MGFTFLTVYFFSPIKLYKFYKGEMREPVLKSRRIAVIFLELVY